MIHGGCSRAARRQRFPLTVLMAFTLVVTGCHRTAPRSETVPVTENRRNTNVSESFEDTVASKPGSPAGSRTFNLQSPGQRDSLHAVVNRQRELWRVGGFRDYDILLRASCFCPGQQGWVLLEVRDGKAVRVWNQGGKPVPLTVDNNYTIDALFDLLQQEADRDDVVAVGFEDRWHYPAYIRTDVRVGRPDDWGIIEVRGFTPR